MVVLSHHHELLPVHVEPELEQRAALVYLQFGRRGCGYSGYGARVMPFLKLFASLTAFEERMAFQEAHARFSGC
jgi:hypothetical protein